jgi:hypothetical protein
MPTACSRPADNCRRSARRPLDGVEDMITALRYELKRRPPSPGRLQVLIMAMISGSVTSSGCGGQDRAHTVGRRQLSDPRPDRRVTHRRSLRADTPAATHNLQADCAERAYRTRIGAAARYGKSRKSRADEEARPCRWRGRMTTPPRGQPVADTAIQNRTTKSRDRRSRGQSSLRS